MTRFYAGAQIRSADGHVLGTLCVLDALPHTLTEEQKAGLRTLAFCVSAHVDHTALVRRRSDAPR